jgi:hypothetical protein
MLKRFAYIVLLMIFAPCLSSAGTVYCRFYKVSGTFQAVLSFKENLADTTLSSKSNKKPVQDDKTKIKEVTKAKKQPKPEKVEPVDNTGAPAAKQRPKRQRRPEGLDRPPEIPRRSGG